MKIYYIYSSLYDQDWIDEIERLQKISVFRDENSIKEALEYVISPPDLGRFEIIKQGKSSELFDQKEPFNMVFAVQALE